MGMSDFLCNKTFMYREFGRICLFNQDYIFL